MENYHGKDPDDDPYIGDVKLLGLDDCIVNRPPPKPKKIPVDQAKEREAEARRLEIEALRVVQAHFEEVLREIDLSPVVDYCNAHGVTCNIFIDVKSGRHSYTIKKLESTLDLLGDVIPSRS